VWQLYSLLLTAASKEVSVQSEITLTVWISALKKGIEAISRCDIVSVLYLLVCMVFVIWLRAIWLVVCDLAYSCLQCFDTLAWASGRASGL